MSDIVFQHGTSGPFRQAGHATAPWIGHPRDGVNQHPRQGPFLLSGEPWAADRTTFEGLIAAGNFRQAMTFVRNSNFLITTADVPEASRDQFVTWTRVNAGTADRDCLSGPGWR